MKTCFAILLLLGGMFKASSQEPKLYFDSQIGKHIGAYKAKSEIASLNRDKAQSQALFDSLFENHLKYSYIRNISLKKVKGGTLEIESIKKPFLLITKSSWEIIKDEEITEVNRMSKMYKGQVKIIILFWDSRKKAKAYSKNYNSNVIVTYVDERENRANHIIKPFKHSFGTPTCFYVSEEKQLLKIDRKFTVSNSKNRSEVAFSAMHEKIKWMLFDNDSNSNGTVTRLR